MGLDPADETGRASGRTPARGEARARLAALRAQLVPPADGRVSCPILPLGLPALDAHLPGGGLALGPPHEIAPAGPADGVAALGFALALCALHLSRVSGEALIAAAPGEPLPYGHGLMGLGLDPGRLLLLEAGGDGEVFRALEAALHARALAALIGLLRDGLPLKPGRRLQLAAEGPDPPLLLLLRPAAAGMPNGAATRWRIAAAPASRDRFGTLDRPRWRARLERCRNGRGGDWLLEWDHAAHRLHLPEPLAGDAAASGRSRA
ncbi:MULTISPECIES: ImuA family protein [unclassified Methylobacterium]|jgi:protein ImuA|uniref:ImuA family protein n=1 Tax=unclassified Methylobacterium TaxID=2615210 RepID=UPI001352DAEF|nr:ImuA protein [Methylobacterium sp. 2A]MWV25427.1 ImuA protein [Methylobacterium sp. 2A]